MTRFIRFAARFQTLRWSCLVKPERFLINCYRLQKQPSRNNLSETIKGLLALSSFWRRERDSNPRYAINVYSLSRGALSTTQPSLRRQTTFGRDARKRHQMARWEGVEPPTFWFVARCSIQLSYQRVGAVLSVWRLIRSTVRCLLSPKLIYLLPRAVGHRL